MIKTTLFFLFLTSNVFADFNFQNKEVLLKMGFKKIERLQQKLLDKKSLYPLSHPEKKLEKLSWPIELIREKHQFIGNMHQIQTYTNPAYYHAGVDILAKRDQLIRTPVSGIIEAGYYSYTDDYYGNTEKFFLPLKEVLENEKEIPWGKAYFEIAVTDRFGTRYEFHHADSEDIPPVILDKILSGNQTVEAGDIVGKVYDWNIKKGKIETRHLHYNIINKQGHYLNPFRYSKEVFDYKKPIITNIYATEKSPCYKAPYLNEFKNSPLETNGEIIVRTLDTINESSFSQAPVLIEAKFENGESFKWDFRDNLINPKTFKRHHIRDVYLFSKCNRKLGTEFRASRNHDFFFRIPVKENYSGKIEITVFDQSMNFTTKTIEVIKVTSDRHPLVI
jgi:murein DD-endopeptidase MepM/ murein hydrolase activator NlpD